MQTYDYEHSFEYYIHYQTRAKHSLPASRGTARCPHGGDWRGRRDAVDREGSRTKACMVIHQIRMGRAHAWLWHEEPGERQPTTAAQPPPATKFHRQPDFTPRAVGTWAAENRGGRMLCQAYLQNQCAGNSCSVRAHVCAMVVRDSGHVFGTDIQHASIGGTSRQPSKRAGGTARKTDIDGATTSH